VRSIQDKKVLDDCLSILSRVCHDEVILPKSCVASNVVLRERWKIGGVSDIFTGKLEQTDVCIKVFRQHEEAVETKIKAVGSTPPCGTVVSPWVIIGVLPTRGTMEVCFA
jgi:hypothetical protein